MFKPSHPAVFAKSKIPPHAWFITSAVCRYAGPTFAVLLFPALGVFGVAWLRILSAATLLAPWSRPWRVLVESDRPTRIRLLSLGACLAAMNTTFYLALDRLPVSLVAAIEFTGTVAIAAVGARTRRNWSAVGLCLCGVFALINVSWKADFTGLCWALLNAALFVGYVFLGHRISRNGAQAGIQRLGTALAIAALLLTPLGLPHASTLVQRPALLWAGVGIGLCSSALPYVCDQFAMVRLPRASFALMLTLLPATAALFGALVLRQIPSLRDGMGILLVMAGITLHRPGETPAPARSHPSTSP